MYRILPNTKVEWRDVWIGAAVTSLLFAVGKLGLGIYIGKGAVELLIWSSGISINPSTVGLLLRVNLLLRCGVYESLR